MMDSAAPVDPQHAPAAPPLARGNAGNVPIERAPLPVLDITSPYGPRSNFQPGEVFHYGVDLEAPEGTAIHSMTGGRVAFAGVYGSGGNTVILRDGQGRNWVYHHMQDLPIVKVGERVKPGQQLGQVGMTGDADGPHLHIGLQVNGRWDDPTRFIKRAFGR